MKVYRIKHKPSGKYVQSVDDYERLIVFTTTTGNIFRVKRRWLPKIESDADYEILYDEIKD